MRRSALKSAIPNGRMCSSCGFGPMINMNCNDMLTHATEANNACPRCGFFTSNWKDYPLWDGRLPEESLIPDPMLQELICMDDVTLLEGEEYPLTTSMGKAKLLAPRLDAVNVLELDWRFAGESKAIMYTKAPLIFSEKIKLFEKDDLETVKNIERFKQWSLHFSDGATAMKLRCGEICMIRRIEKEWERREEYSRHDSNSLTNTILRLCLVQGIDETDNTLMLLTEDFYCLGKVPRDAVTPLKPSLGRQYWMHVSSDDSASRREVNGWLLAGNIIGKEQSTVEAAVSPSFSNVKANGDAPRWVTNAKSTKLFAEPSFDADLVATVDQNTVLRASDFLELEETVGNYDAIARSILGHSGEWRDQTKLTWCSAELDAIKCNHGGRVLRGEHWSCCGARTMYEPCVAYKFKVHDQVRCALPRRYGSRYYSGTVTGYNKENNTYSVLFDDGDSDDNIPSADIQRNTAFTIEEQGKLKYDESVLVKTKVVETLNHLASDDSKGCSTQRLFEDVKHSVYCVDFSRSLLFLPHGDIFSIKYDPVFVDLVHSKEDLQKAKTRRIEVPMSWSLFAYQARKVLDCHQIVSANVMVHDEEYGWSRGDLLNKTTYKAALSRLGKNCIIACHEFSSPQNESNTFGPHYVFMIGEVVAYVENKKGRKAPKRGRILGVDETTSKFELLSLPRERNIKVSRENLRRFDQEEDVDELDSSSSEEEE